MARGQDAIGLKEYLENKHGVEVIKLEVEGIEVPDDADLAGWIGTVEGHEVRVHTQTQEQPEQAEQQAEEEQAAEEQPEEPEPAQEEQPVEASEEEEQPDKISIKLSDHVALVLEKGFFLEENKLHLEKSLLKTIQTAAIASDSREPSQIIAQAGVIVAQRLRNWGPEVFPMVVFAGIALLFAKIEGKNKLVVLTFSGLVLIFLTNIILSVVFGYNVLSELNLPELFKKVDSPDDLVAEVPKTALPYIEDTDRVVDEMRAKLTRKQHIYMFLTSIFPTAIDPWQKEMRRRRSVYEEAVAIVRRRQTQS